MKIAGNTAWTFLALDVVLVASLMFWSNVHPARAHLNTTMLSGVCLLLVPAVTAVGMYASQRWGPKAGIVVSLVLMTLPYAVYICLPAVSGLGLKR